MILIKKADTIYEDGTTENGYFIKEWFAGFILGLIICSFFNICFDLIKEIENKKYNYIIPKQSAKGLYIQLEDGKLYKKQ